jgi:hypothetical protein
MSYEPKFSRTDTEPSVIETYESPLKYVILGDEEVSAPMIVKRPGCATESRSTNGIDSSETPKQSQIVVVARSGTEVSTFVFTIRGIGGILDMLLASNGGHEGPIIFWIVAVQGRGRRS